jgi:hypothetical protein
MAYFQQVINGGGYIDREYAVGSGRIDLCVRWPLPDGKLQVSPLDPPRGTLQRFALELKVWRQGQPGPVESGLVQVGRYLERLGLDAGTLLIFDQREDAPPFAERGVRETRTVDGRPILVLRL